MKRSALELIILEIVAIFILLLNIFLKNIMNSEYLLSIFIGIVLFISVLLVGFEKKKILQERKVVGIIGFYTISILIIMYGLGLLSGYVINTYSQTFPNIIKNILPVIILIVLTELFRYNVCKKGGTNNIIYYLSVFVTTIIDVVLMLKVYDMSELSELLKMTTVVIIPSISKNLMLSNFSKRYGYLSCIIYRLVMELYIYLIPIIPDLGYYLESVVMFLIPIIMVCIVNSTLRVEREEVVIGESRKQKIVIRIVSIFCILIIALIVLLSSNLFNYWIAVVGTGSMEPTIKIGDAIIVDKRIKKNLDSLKKGNVIVFRENGSIYNEGILTITNGKRLKETARKMW